VVQLFHEVTSLNYLINAITSYISDRFGYVEIENNRSNVEKIRAGCIQGSIIGPLLFNIYTSSLDKIVHPFKTVAYADDSYVVISGESLDEMTQMLKTTIQKHFDWLGSIGMTCNLGKTELISFCGQAVSVNIGNIEIKSKDSMKILGVMLDKELSWNAHIDKLIMSCKKLTFALRYLRTNVDLEVMKEVIRAQVVSKLTYAAPVWSHRLTYHQRTRLKSAYFKILRNVLRDFEFRLNRNELLRLTGQESLDVIFAKRTSMFLFKIITSISPTNLATTILSKCYYNERTPCRLTFFDTSRSRFGRACISNATKLVVESWDFDWLNLTPFSFKNQLASKYENRPA